MTRSPAKAFCFCCLFHQVIPTMKGPLPLPTSIASGSSMSSPFLMPSHISPFLHGGAQQCTVTLPALYHQSGSSAYFSMDSFNSLPPALDSLDSLSITDFKTGRLLVAGLLGQGLYEYRAYKCSFGCYLAFSPLLVLQIMLRVHSWRR